VDDDDPRDAPGQVIGGVAAGVAPLPFLAVYAVLFIARGTVRPVIPPDIGNSKGDELVAGLIALVLFVIGAVAAFWFLSGRRRWLFALCQLATLGASIYLISDSTTGSPAIPILLVVTSVVALALAFAPQAWEHMRSDVPVWLRRPGSARTVDTAESGVPPASGDLRAP
jgi:hypothetical protein